MTVKCTDYDIFITISRGQDAHRTTGHGFHCQRRGHLRHGQQKTRCSQINRGWLYIKICHIQQTHITIFNDINHYP